LAVILPISSTKHLDFENSWYCYDAGVSAVLTGRITRVPSVPLQAEPLVNVAYTLLSLRYVGVMIYWITRKKINKTALLGFYLKKKNKSY
jgi:hypothetical protein